MKRHQPTHLMRALAVLSLLLLSLPACDDSEALGGFGPFERDADLSELQAKIAAGPTRLEVDLDEDRIFLAENVVIEDDDALGDVESIEGEIIAPGMLDFDPDGDCAGTITLRSGITVLFDETVTEFEDEDFFFDDELDCQQFVDRVFDDLDDGDAVSIQALRQDPTAADPTGEFLAERIAIDAGEEGTELDLEVGPENLVSCEEATSPPAGCLLVLRVLGDEIFITDGTDLSAQERDFDDEVDVEGTVARVDLDRGVVVLEDGTEVMVVDSTDIEVNDDEDLALGALNTVQAAIDAGETVVLDAEGFVNGDSAQVVAFEVEMEVTSVDE